MDDADTLEAIRFAVRNYHYALDTRQHGDVAANAAICKIMDVLGMPWAQGEELDRREKSIYMDERRCEGK